MPGHLTCATPAQRDQKRPREQSACGGLSPSLEDIVIGFHFHCDAILEMKGESSHDRLRIYSEETLHWEFRFVPLYSSCYPPMSISDRGTQEEIPFSKRDNSFLQAIWIVTSEIQIWHPTTQYFSDTTLGLHLLQL